jgi:hypothetical protein
MQYLLIDWSEIGIESVISPGAVTMLNFAKKDDHTFLSQIYRSILPSRSELDQLNRERDDGAVLKREVDELLVDLKRVTESGVLDGDAGEDGVV